MLLSTWIAKKGGTIKAGALLGTERNNVYAWMKGRACPRPQAMRLIVQKSGGSVSYADIVDEYLKKHESLAAGTKRKPKPKKPKGYKVKTAPITFKTSAQRKMEKVVVPKRGKVGNHMKRSFAAFNKMMKAESKKAKKKTTPKDDDGAGF